MIHDPQVEVTCDGKWCDESIHITPEYTYNDYSGKSGQYACEDSDIEAKLLAEDWIVCNGKHYCCEECAEAV